MCESKVTADIKTPCSKSIDGSVCELCQIRRVDRKQTQLCSGKIFFRN